MKYMPIAWALSKNIVPDTCSAICIICILIIPKTLVHFQCSGSVWFTVISLFLHEVHSPHSVSITFSSCVVCFVSARSAYLHLLCVSGLYLPFAENGNSHQSRDREVCSLQWHGGMSMWHANIPKQWVFSFLNAICIWFVPFAVWIQNVEISVVSSLCSISVIKWWKMVHIFSRRPKKRLNPIRNCINLSLV